MKTFVWLAIAVFVLDATGKLMLLAMKKPLERSTVGLAVDIAISVVLIVAGTMALMEAP